MKYVLMTILGQKKLIMRYLLLNDQTRHRSVPGTKQTLKLEKGHRLTATCSRPYSLNVPLLCFCFPLQCWISVAIEAIEKKVGKPCCSQCTSQAAIARYFELGFFTSLLSSILILQSLHLKLVLIGSFVSFQLVRRVKNSWRKIRTLKN